MPATETPAPEPHAPARDTADHAGDTYARVQLTPEGNDSDLAIALYWDDRNEDHGMPASERATCHQCKSWADHAHDWLTNERITLAEYDARRMARGW